MRVLSIVPAPVLAALAALTITLAPIGPSVALAAPAEQACASGAVAQRDMAGTYVSAEHQMRVEIYACGGAYVQWDNAWGTHYAAYGTVSRVPAEGVIARRLPDTAESLDATDVIGFKAAEKGYIQVFTANAYGEIVGVYRLRKVA